MKRIILTVRSDARKTHSMARRKLFKKHKNLNLMLSERTVDRIDQTLAEGETRTDFLRDAAERELQRREKAKKASKD